MIKTKIKKLMKTFSASDTRIAKYILDHNNNEIASSSITSFATKVNVSAATINRFCNKLEYNGFKEFKMYLFQEDVEKSKTNADNEIRSIIETRRSLDKSSFQILVDRISESKNNVNINIYSSGFSMVLTKYFSRQLNKMNIRTTVHNTSDPTGLFWEDGIALFISISGNSSDMKLTANKLVKSGAKNKNVFSISSTRKMNTKDISNYHIHGVVHSGTNIAHEKEVPTLNSMILHYILNKIFEGVFQKNNLENEEYLKTFSRKKLVK